MYWTLEVLGDQSPLTTHHHSNMSTLHYDDKGHPASAPIEPTEDQTNEKKLDVYETNVQIKLAEDE